MNLCYIKEDTLPKKLSVIFSKEITSNIDTIYEYNLSNNAALSQWYDYIEGIKRYISNPSIAWDYANQHLKYPNGTRFVRNFNIGYTVKTNDYGAYVYIFQMDLKPQEFGLKVPPTIKENKQESNRTNIMKTNKNVVRLTESNLRNIIAESVKRVLNETYFEDDEIPYPFFVVDEGDGVLNPFAKDMFDKNGYLDGHEDEDGYHFSDFDIVRGFKSWEAACRYTDKYSN